MASFEVETLNSALQNMSFPAGRQFVAGRVQVPVDEQHVGAYLKVYQRSRSPWSGEKLIQWAAYWFDHDGYGRSNNELVKQLLQRGWNINPRWVIERGEPKNSVIPEIKALQPVDRTASLHMAFLLAPDVYVLDKPDGKFLFYFPWESTVVNHTWVPILAQADGIVTCSNWCANVIRSCVENVPVFNVPVAVDTTFFAPAIRPYKSPFKVLYVSASYERKGLDTAINAFRKAFEGRYDVKMTIHTRKDRLSDASKSMLESWIKGDVRISYTTDTKTDEEIRQLYYDHHVLIHPARSEGFGRSACEAMATGMPVLATGATGLTEFMSEETGYPLPVKHWKACNHAFYRNGQWAEVDMEGSAAILKQVEANYPEACNRAMKGALFVQKFNPSTIADRMEDVLMNVNRLKEYEREYAEKWKDDLTHWKDKDTVADIFGD